MVIRKAQEFSPTLPDGFSTGYPAGHEANCSMNLVQDHLIHSCMAWLQLHVNHEKSNGIG